MGYTHYWEWANPIADQVYFSSWSRGVSLLLQHLPAHGYNNRDPLVIRSFRGDGEPLCSDDEVSFNGDYTMGQDFGHEGFRITFDDLKDKDHFNCCKTAAKPYDLLVTAALIRFAYHFPDAIITSDGYAGAWEKASLLCEQVFGKDRGLVPSTIPKSK